jgi:hypothetical protein
MALVYEITNPEDGVYIDFTEILRACFMDSPDIIIQPVNMYQIAQVREVTRCGCTAYLYDFNGNRKLGEIILIGLESMGVDNEIV